MLNDKTIIIKINLIFGFVFSFIGFEANQVQSAETISSMKRIMSIIPAFGVALSLVVIYFYPKDFTFICPTEITGMDALMREVDVYGISGDNEYCKLAWKREHEDLNKIEHILLADRGLNLSEEIGIVDYDEGVCLRATFIIDPENIVKHVSCNELDTGRSADEILRTLGALQAGGLTGCQWKPGDEFVG